MGGEMGVDAADGTVAFWFELPSASRNGKN
jgi:hypothetical protein